MQVLLRSPRIAQRVFGLDSPGQIVRSVPRAKFMFKAEFIPSAAANDMMNQINLNSSTDIRSIAFKVKSIDKPKVNFTTVELNHYNKKKLAYTKVDYGEASIRVYDSVDNSLLALWVNYFTYFFGDSRIKDDYTTIQQGSVQPRYYDSTGWGFRPINENVQFFDSIDVLAFYGQTVTTFRYMNPKITSIDWQNKDYSVPDLEEATISFKYEAIKYERFGQPVVSDIDTGWESTDTIDYPYGYATTPAAFQPRLFSNQTNSIYNRDQTLTNTTSPTNVVNSLPYNTSAIAPGATIPNSLLNSNMLQPNNLVAGLSMALNYIPNGIQGINNFPFTTLLSLGGIKGIGGMSQILGDAIRTQVSGVSSSISNLFDTSKISNIFSSGVPQPAGYMSGSTSSPFPDITTNGDLGSGTPVDPGAIGGQATSPDSSLTSRTSYDPDGIGIGGPVTTRTASDPDGIGADGSQTLEAQLPNSEEAQPIGSIEYAAVEDTPPPSFADDPAPSNYADDISVDQGTDFV